jgi:hypothetical protein
MLRWISFDAGVGKYLFTAVYSFQTTSMFSLLLLLLLPLFLLLLPRIATTQNKLPTLDTNIPLPPSDGRSQERTSHEWGDVFSSTWETGASRHMLEGIHWTI